ncbi:MAG TPA: R3H domain-containing nucleic acid-binding protein [Terriglobia bacterium]|nr:R3H domain-containing nucleic acid-binding protein [Terriglobia bacterium]
MAPENPSSAGFTLGRYRAPLEALLREIIRHGRFKLDFTFHSPETSPETSGDDSEAPEIVVEFSGPDSDLLVEAHAELLNAIEYVVLRAVRLEESLYPKILFDCQDVRRLRVEELKLMAQVAADRVQETGMPFPLSPMNARERRIVHLALHGRPEVTTESDGQGPERRVIIRPAPSATPHR